MRSPYNSIPGTHEDSVVPFRDEQAFFVKRRIYQFLCAVIFISAAAAVAFSSRSLPRGSITVLRKSESDSRMFASNPHSQVGAEQKQLFDDFIVKHGKTYGSESEYLSRYEIFRDNLALIASRTAQEKASGGSAVHGITTFADLTPKEFDNLLTLDPLSSFQEPQEPAVLQATAATSSDWRSRDVTAMKNGGQYIVGESGYTGYFNNEAWMQNYVLTTGPLAACIDASSISTYTSGIISTCPTSKCNHAIQLVGINTASSPPYWIVSDIFILIVVAYASYIVFIISY